MSFRSGAKTFVLVTLHVLFGKGEEERLPELRAIAGWLAGWARNINGWDHNLIALGDFNIDRRGDALHDAFVSTGLDIPEDLQGVPRTIFADPGKPELDKFYDQIAWFTGRGGLPALSLRYSRGGFFDFTKSALSSRGLTKTRLSWRLSDPYPLWAEVSVRDWPPLVRYRVNPQHAASVRHPHDWTLAKRGRLSARPAPPRPLAPGPAWR